MPLNNFSLRLVKALVITLPLSIVLHYSAAVPCNVTKVTEGEEATLFCDFENHTNRVIKVYFYEIKGTDERIILQCRENFQSCKAEDDFKHKVVDNRYMHIKFIANKSHEGNYSCAIVPTDQLRECTLHVVANSVLVDHPVNGTTPTNDTHFGESGTNIGSLLDLHLIVALVLGLTGLIILVITVLAGIVIYDVRRRPEQERRNGHWKLVKESLEKRLCCCSTRKHRNCQKDSSPIPENSTILVADPAKDDETDSAQTQSLLLEATSDLTSFHVPATPSKSDVNRSSKLDANYKSLLSTQVEDGGGDSQPSPPLLSVVHDAALTVLNRTKNQQIWLNEEMEERLKKLLNTILKSVDDLETDSDTGASITLGVKEKDTALLNVVPTPPSYWPKLEKLSKQWYKETLAPYLAKEFSSDETPKLQKYLLDLELVLSKVQVYLQELNHFSAPLHVNSFNPKVLEPKLIAVKEICKIRIDILKEAIAQSTGRKALFKRTHQMLERTFSDKSYEEAIQQKSSRDYARTSKADEEDIRN